MNTRIRKLRKILDLTQQEFGLRIGIKANTVTMIEKGRNTSEQTIQAICREFHVNEEWLRTGIGEMFQPEPRDAIDELIERYHLPREYRSLTEKFIELKPEQQEAVIEYIRKVAAALMEDEPPVPPGYSSRAEMEAEARAEAEEYYREILEEKRRAVESAALQDDTGNGARLA